MTTGGPRDLAGPAPGATPEPRAFLPLEIAALGLAAAGFLARIPLLAVRWFDPDELEHLHAGWCLAKGLLPGRGFFDQHPPGVWILLSPVLAAIRPERDFESARNALVAGRVVMLVLTGVLLVVVHRLGNRLGGRPIGAVAVLVTSAFTSFVEKSMEVRPDVLSTPLWAASLLVLVGCLDDARAGARRFAASGLLFGTAFFFGTQKVAFAFPCLAVGLLVHAFGSSDPRPARSRFTNVFWWGAGSLVPGAVLLGGFAAFGGARDLVELYLVNLRWTNRVHPWIYIRLVLQKNALLVAVSTLAVAWGALRLATGRSTLRHAGIPLAGLGGIALGVVLIPEVHPHYYLPAWPLLGILSASLLVDLLAPPRAAASGERWARKDTAVLAAGLALFLAIHRTEIPDLHPALTWFDASPARDLALVAVAWAAFRVRRGPGLVLAALALASTPYRQIRLLSSYDGRAFLSALRYVHDTTRPDDPCLDGYTGFGVFRPHVLRYFAATAAICAQIPPAERNALVEGLRSGAVRPALVFVDPNLKQLSPHLEEALAERYHPVRKDCPLYAPSDRTRRDWCATTWRPKE